MAKESCHNCVYACWDLCQVAQSLRARWPHRPTCANQPEAPGLMRPTPVGRTCRNYRPRPATPEGDIKRIPLGGGHYAYVDAADYEWLSRYTWHLYNTGYAARREKGKMIFMHREIMKPPKGMVVDHIDGNKGNNCRFNLRVCTRTENHYNRAKRSNASSRFKGVGYDKRSEKYYAKFGHDGRSLWLGYFDDEVEAARAYDHKAVECCGPFARVNLPEEWPPERIQQVHAEAQAKLKRESEEGVKSEKRVKGSKAGRAGSRKPRHKRRTRDATRTTKRGTGTRAKGKRPKHPKHKQE